jgi:hypothetical protein
MDNFHIDITSEGRDEFNMAVGLAMAHVPGGKVVAYCMHPDRGMVLFWDWDPKENGSFEGHPVQKLLYQMNAKALSDFAWGWLLGGSDYGEEPDHDGDNHKGWRVYNESWGHVGDCWRARLAIHPEWALYGK